MNTTLIEKYNKAVPRYTSYPTVPHWQQEAPTEKAWFETLLNNCQTCPEISLYIHLPYCESLCTYCGCNKRITKNHEVESSYIDAVIKEWEIYLKHFENKPVIKEIHLGGGTPTFFSAENLERLISTILSNAIVTDNHEFSFEAHPDSTTVDHLIGLHRLGFRRVSVGVQDVSPNILKAINRFQSSDEILGLTNWARSIGYTSVNYDLIYGLPFQKPMNIWETGEFVARALPDRIAFYSYAHVPWKSAGQRAFTLEDVPAGQQKNELYKLGSYLLEKQGYQAVGMDHFCLPEENLYQAYQKGKMHRNFMGYTANYTRCSIALGASSISDCWTMYIQNEKNIEAYKAIVNQGKLPIIKGHQLNKSAQSMRKVILDLMCRNQSDWSDCSQENVYSDNLLALEADGLIQWDGQLLNVTEAGKYFIRNICAAIDPLFQNARIDKPLFSKAI